MRDVLKAMRQKDASGRAVKFSIAVRTLNKYSKTGGEYREYKGAKEVMQEDGVDYNSVEMLLKKPSKKKTRKDPKHHDNKTRNIRLASGEIKKIHIRHIVEFNGKKVLY